MTWINLQNLHLYYFFFPFFFSILRIYFQLFFCFWSQKKSPTANLNNPPKKRCYFAPPPISMYKIDFFRTSKKVRKFPIGNPCRRPKWHGNRVWYCKFDRIFFEVLKILAEPYYWENHQNFFFEFFLHYHVQILTEFRRKFQNLTFFSWISSNSAIGKTIKNTKNKKCITIVKTLKNVMKNFRIT